MRIHSQEFYYINLSYNSVSKFLNNMRNSNNIKEVAHRTTHVTNESLESTRRMLGLMHESQDAGAKTLQMLHHQGDKLNRTEKGLDNVHTSLLKSENHLKEMEKGCGSSPCMLCCPGKKKVNKQHSDSKDKNDSLSAPLEQNKMSQKLNKQQMDSKDKHDSLLSPLEQNKMRQKYKNGQVGISSRLDDFEENNNKNESYNHGPNSKTFPHDPITAEKESKKNLDAINAHIGGLKNQAIDLGQNVTSHNTQITRLNNKAEKNIGKIDIVTNRTTNLINDVSKEKFKIFKCCRLCRIL